jgi:hypothetical protein
VAVNLCPIRFHVERFRMTSQCSHAGHPITIVRSSTSALSSPCHFHPDPVASLAKANPITCSLIPCPRDELYDMTFRRGRVHTSIIPETAMLLPLNFDISMRSEVPPSIISTRQWRFGRCGARSPRIDPKSLAYPQCQDENFDRLGMASFW